MTPSSTMTETESRSAVTPPSAPDAAELARVESLIALVPDFPSPGIQFRDLTPVFADASAFRTLTQALTAPFLGEYDYVAGVEARGFLLAGAASMLTDAGTLTVRKAGKLPRATAAESYSLEYGTATLELHREDIPAGGRVLVLDDVLATGGTIGATCRLVEQLGGVVAGIAVALELEELGGRSALPGRRIHSVFTV